MKKTNQTGSEAHELYVFASDIFIIFEFKSNRKKNEKRY
jgi:hypothetical protein